MCDSNKGNTEGTGDLNIDKLLTIPFMRECITLKITYINYLVRFLEIYLRVFFCKAVIPFTAVGWLEDAAFFAAIDDSLNTLSWYDWPEPLRNRHLVALEDIFQQKQHFVRS